MAADDAKSVPDGLRLPLLTAELAQYVVVIAPMSGGPGTREKPASVDLSAPGSGTCVLAGGRYFIATAAHVIMGRAPQRNFIVTPNESRIVLPIVGGRFRGGENGEDDDVGWLELDPAHAKRAGRKFLDVARMRTHCTGMGESIAVSGAPVVNQTREDQEGKLPLITSNAEWYPVDAIRDTDDLGSGRPVHPDHLYVRWPRVRGDGSENPEPRGISGGGVWATNTHVEPWRADAIQLIGIENAIVREGVRERYLKANQIQVWLAMLAEDIPELAPQIKPIIAAGRCKL